MSGFIHNLMNRVGQLGAPRASLAPVALPLRGVVGLHLLEARAAEPSRSAGLWQGGKKTAQKKQYTTRCRQTELF